MNPSSAKPLALLAACAALSLAPLPPAEALPVVNGDFSDPVALSGWSPGIPPGSVINEPTGEFAQLATDGTDQRTLEQTFLLPATPSTLAFDFAFSTSVASVSEQIYPDSFTVSLITVGGEVLDILVVDIFKPVADPSNGFESMAGVLPIDVDLDLSVEILDFSPLAGGPSYSGRVNLLLPTAVLGQEATLYFDPFDKAEDLAATIAAVDNVSVDPANAAPVPATPGLLLIGLAATSATRRRRPLGDGTGYSPARVQPSWRSKRRS